MRLILGVSLVAVVPLAVAMFLLSQRIQETVRAQASDRLSAALGMMRAQLADDGRRIEDRIRLLGRDPALRRLLILQPEGGRDLAEYLAEKRFLLGLDFLAVTDTLGNLIADGSTAPSAVEREAHAWPAGLVLVSHRYGARFAAIPDSNALALVSNAPVPYRNQVAGLVQGGVVLDARFLGRLERTSGIGLSLGPRRRSVASPLAAAAEDGDASSFSRRSVALGIGPSSADTLTGFVSTAAADETIGALRVTSLLLGLLGVAIAIVLGVAWSWQVSRPVERLARFSERIAQGHWDEPLALHSVRELETLVTALDRMRLDLRDYRARLVAGERQAAWSQMARKVAHEVKNPLTPIAISIADLKRSYEQGRPEFPQILDQAVRTIGEEIEALKRLLQEFSEFGRLPAPEFKQCRAGDLLADVATLYTRDVVEGRLVVHPPRSYPSFPADRAQLRQALVNLIKNGLEATGGHGRVVVAAAVEDGAVVFSVRDDGPGLTEAQRANLFVPDFTTKPQGSGLGLAIVHRIVTDHHGAIDVTSGITGTTFRIRLPIEREVA